MTDFSVLREQVQGAVLTADDAEFVEASRPWNRAVRQHPVAVVEPENVSDVVRVVNFARENRLGVHVQPHGHGASGAADGTILVRTRSIASVEIDQQNQIARVGSGASVGDVQAALAPLHLTALAGSTPAVNFVGLMLGGGLSWFGRAHGWVADTVTAIEIVDADGNERTVDASHDPDLFWALRGGGGDYAFVVAVHVRVFHAPQISGGRMMWSGEAREAVVDAYRMITANAPRELSAWLELLSFPGSAPMVAIDVAYLGAVDQLRELLEVTTDLPQPLQDSIRPLRADELGTIADEPTDPAPGTTRFELLTAVDDEVAAGLASFDQSPLMIVQVRHLGGALAEASDTPHGALTEPYSISFFGVPFSPEMAAALSSRQQQLVAQFPVSGRKPLSFLEQGERATESFGAESYARLARIKQAVDPDNLFRSNFPVAS